MSVVSTDTRLLARIRLEAPEAAMLWSAEHDSYAQLWRPGERSDVDGADEIGNGLVAGRSMCDSNSTEMGL